MNTLEVSDLKAFLPARDYALSLRFYEALGFKVNFSNQDVTEFQLGQFRFLLTPFYEQAYAENVMMQLTVKDLEAWWLKIQALDLVSHYPGIICKAPKPQSWGLKVMYLGDPSGVLWHIAQDPQS